MVLAFPSVKIFYHSLGTNSFGNSEAYPEAWQRYKMELPAKTVNDFRSLTTFAKCSGFRVHLWNQRGKFPFLQWKKKRLSFTWNTVFKNKKTCSKLIITAPERRWCRARNFLSITNSREFRRVSTANLLHTMQLPNSLNQKQPQEAFYKKAVLINFPVFTGKHYAGFSF